MPQILTSATIAFCPHMGKIQFNSPHPSVQAGGAPVIAVGEVSSVIGCPFATAAGPMPCLTVEWSTPATSTYVDSVAVLTSASVGACLNPAPAGQAIIEVVQPRVQAE